MFCIFLSGEGVTKQPLIKAMRGVKKDSLTLINCWVNKSSDPKLVKSLFIQALTRIPPYLYIPLTRKSTYLNVAVISYHAFVKHTFILRKPLEIQLCILLESRKFINLSLVMKLLPPNRPRIQLKKVDITNFSFFQEDKDETSW